MVTAYSRSGYRGEAVRCYRRMQLDGVFPTAAAVIGILDCLEKAEEAQELQAHVREDGFLSSDTGVQNEMLALFGRLGSLEDVLETFESISARDISSWNMLLVSMVRHQAFAEAVEVYREMQLQGEKPSRITFVGVLDACSRLQDTVFGSIIQGHVHERGYEGDIMVGNSLVNMYSRSSWRKARRVFEKIPRKNVVSWNGIISAGALRGSSKDVFGMFSRMSLEGTMADSGTYFWLLRSCGILRTMGVHSRIT